MKRPYHNVTYSVKKKFFFFCLKPGIFFDLILTSNFHPIRNLCRWCQECVFLLYCFEMYCRRISHHLHSIERKWMKNGIQNWYYSEKKNKIYDFLFIFFGVCKYLCVNFSYILIQLDIFGKMWLHRRSALWNKNHRSRRNKGNKVSRNGLFRYCFMFA